ncbi:MAG: 4Fe-4S binding protein [Bacteroidales bacterium]|nr:4Fe-4S binding protein [Bacteroidales bacterium]
MGKRLTSILSFIILFSCSLYAGVKDSVSIPENCKTCTYVGDQNQEVSTSSIITKMIIILAVIAMATAYGWFTYRKKLYLFLGTVALVLVGGSYIYALVNTEKIEKTALPCGPTCVITDSIKSASPVVSPDSSKFIKTDEFNAIGDEFQNADSIVSNDEFSSSVDSFSDNSTNEIPAPIESNNKLLYQIIILLLLSAVIGLTLQYTFVRNLRGIIMLSSVVYLGFIGGACPCMIMSFQDFVLFILGSPVLFVSMLWFIGLVVVSYFFGKTWCGWLCHLGGLQDFLFRINSRKWLASEKSQKIISYVQIGLLVVLIVQLLLTRSIVWIKYDPFKVAFNFISANATGYILVVLLLVSSVLVYRPFCRIACPVGLILGWVTKIPGARKLSISSSCVNCKSCVKSCKQQSIAIIQNKVIVKTQDCILCGDCLESCKKNSICLKNKSLL